MSRFIRYTIILFVLVLWLGGLSSTISHWLYETGVIVDDYRYGDLYRLSNLPQFKDKQPECPPSNRSSDTARTHLYIIGDSFSEPQRVNKQDFRVSHFQRVQWDHLQAAQLNPNKRNVLLIESVERHFREHFARPVAELVVQQDTTQAAKPKLSWRRRIGDDIHLSDIEERLESALFSHDLFFWFKELKASLTYRLFDRSSPAVSLSTDHEHVLLNMDTDTTKRLNSSFSTLTDLEVATLVDSVNSVAERYKRLGFDEVYISIIPNKTTILDPNRGEYNHLIERIQQHPALRVSVIDTYRVYKQTQQRVYLVGDSHWNCTGRALWLNQVRQKLGI
ncbi:hypothetical protein BN8_03862 [Fibrisoma limi BUZ 3]|uniref:AlgX/AlgJ SGNH hydrolase-like domain-containing protein n=1 Tax=Fibrisoma limi BUZ 3 TaxID=1185876 RepID=I2GL91_9BACT|nr:hypothetical protein [Fibrisoma limi]CCH54667.1 hypothetical protein BN8_03862 [Fibrisoma limi BUZ 3]